MTEPNAVTAPIEARREIVERELTDAAGGVSLCAISRSGGQVDGVKYLEGRLAALMELRRRLRRADGSAADEVTRVAAEWREHLVDARERDQGSAWIAYRAGGTDELEELVAELDETADR